MKYKRRRLLIIDKTYDEEKVIEKGYSFQRNSEISSDLQINFLSKMD